MKVLEDLDYLFSKINWGQSNLDAKAIQIMNSLKADITKALLAPSVKTFIVTYRDDDYDKDLYWSVTAKGEVEAEDLFRNTHDCLLTIKSIIEKT